MRLDPVLLVVTPLISAFLLSLVKKLTPRLAPSLALGLSVFTLVLSTLLAKEVYINGPVASYLGGWNPRIGISLLADQASVLLVLLVSWGQTLGLVFIASYRGFTHWPGKYLVFSSIFTCSLIGMALTADLFNLFVFIELSTVATIGIMAKPDRPLGSVAGFVYLIVASVSGSLLLIGVVLVYSATGSLSMAVIAQEIHALPPGLYWGILLCFTLSLGMKFGLVPMHFWQPWAYHAAGCTGAALLTAFGMKAYLFAFFRVLWVPLQLPSMAPVFFPVLTLWGLANIILGHTMGLIQKDYKKLLALSSTAHGGYILVAAGLAGSMGTTTAGLFALAAGFFHMLNHSLVKASLLWVGRSFLKQASSSTIDVLKASPLGTGIFVLAALGIVGIPPTGGFASKLFIASSAGTPAPVIIIGLGTLISLAYYLRIYLILRDQTSTPSIVKSNGTSVRELNSLFVPGILAMGVLFIGFSSSIIMPVLLNGAGAMMDSGTYILHVLGDLP